MQRAYDDSYFVPEMSVSLATLGVPPYSPPDEIWAAADAPYRSDRSGGADTGWPDAIPATAPETAGSGAGISFADMVRMVGTAPDPEVWRDDNRAPFWTPEDQRALAGPSYDDLVRTIYPSDDPAIWQDAGAYRPAERYDATPEQMRGGPAGAFRIPGLPEDAADWSLRGPMPPGLEEAIQLAARKPWLDGGELLARIWKRIGGRPGGRMESGSPATAPHGTRDAPLGSPAAPSRNPPGFIGDRPYSGHAFDKMQDLGITPRVVEDTILSNKPIAERAPGVSKYYSKEHDVSVIVNDTTKNVITVRYGP